jgi:cation diffusion facilitator CzcD-associated flavoprotein CzcO
VLNRDNVGIVNINPETKYGTPIKEFTEKGIITSDGEEREYDIIALATGFDVVTGGMTNMGLKSINGTYLQDEWKDGAHTYLGTTISGYPNLYVHLSSSFNDATDIPQLPLVRTSRTYPPLQRSIIC